jgi:beta-glucanase (GH16 family)
MAVKFHAFLVGLGVFLIMMAGGLGVRWILSDHSTTETFPEGAPKPKLSATPTRTPNPTTALPSPTPAPTTARPTLTTLRPPTTPPTTTEPPPPPPPPPPTWTLVWSDSLDSLANFGGASDVPSGDACLTNRAVNLFVDSGAMTLRAVAEDAMCGGESHPYTSAAVSSGRSFTYGAFEVRAHGPGGTTTGLQPSFSLGGDVGSMAITGSELHTYRIEWEAGVVRYYVDGAAAGGGNTSADQPHTIHFSLGVNGADGGTTLPADLVVDSVAVYQR